MQIHRPVMALGWLPAMLCTRCAPLQQRCCAPPTTASCARPGPAIHHRKIHTGYTSQHTFTRSASEEGNRSKTRLTPRRYTPLGLFQESGIYTDSDKPTKPIMIHVIYLELASSQTGEDPVNACLGCGHGHITRARRINQVDNLRLAVTGHLQAIK